MTDNRWSSLIFSALVLKCVNFIAGSSRIANRQDSKLTTGFPVLSKQPVGLTRGFLRYRTTRTIATLQ